jgi:hypothetical protein
VRSGNNGLLLAALQSPSITPSTLELALVTAMYGCNADAAELLLMAGKALRCAPNQTSLSIHREAGADARCLNAPDNPPALLLAAACDGFEMLQMVDTCVFAIVFRGQVA